MYLVFVFFFIVRLIINLIILKALIVSCAITGQSSQGTFPPEPANSENMVQLRRPSSGMSPVEEKRAIRGMAESSTSGELKDAVDPNERRTFHSVRVFGFPLPVFFVIGHVFCERFAYSGMMGV